MDKNIICVIQARMDSSRLPAKVVAPIGGDSLLYYVIRRVSLSKLDKIVVATTKMTVDDIIEFVSQKCKVDCIRGDELDVLSRFVQTADLYNADAVIRITADCPLIDPEVINNILELYNEDQMLDYILIEGYPRGLGDVELISNSALETCSKDTDITQTYYREHVMTYIIDNPDKFNIYIGKTNEKYENYRLCVDELDDLRVVREVYNYFLPKIDFYTKDIVDFLNENPHVPDINKHIKQKTS
jgi:spore coat polysaccharide biosynthesis protein SpsF (cytidylyltransferase family)